MLRPRHCLVSVILLLGTPVAAQTFGPPLSPEQVACEERQLERLQHGMWVHLEGSTLLLWRASAGGGLYRGIVTTSELGPDDTGKPVREEEQLAFDLVLKAEEDFLDPHRPRRPQATLVRRDVASNLSSEPEIPFHILDLTLDLTPEAGVDPASPRLPIRITNRLTAGAGADDRAGRGIAIDDLLSPCHTEVSNFDLRIFSILARTVRPSQCLLEPISTCNAGLERFKSVLFRGADPLSYRMNIYPYLFSGITDARIALLFRLQVDNGGRLIGGDVQVLPLCRDLDQVDCTNTFSPGFALFVLPPLRPGVERQGDAEFLRAAHLNLDYDGSPYNVLEDTVNWADLLSDTAWNGGLVP